MSTLTINPSTTGTSKNQRALQALDLRMEFPRSPRATLAGYVLAARILDKCRATLNGTNGEYNYNCPLDRLFFDFTGINAHDFSDFVATGANDKEVAKWIESRSRIDERIDLVRWNNEQRYRTINQKSDEAQLYFEDYIAEHFPNARIIYAFDVLDYDEKRLTETYSD